LESILDPETYQQLQLLQRQFGNFIYGLVQPWRLYQVAIIDWSDERLDAQP
jgi:hypothetical protein